MQLASSELQFKEVWVAPFSCVTDRAPTNGDLVAALDDIMRRCNARIGESVLFLLPELSLNRFASSNRFC